MTSRLDRLFLLLDTGSSPVTRRAAAVQLGEVQKLHPHELHNLLAKVRKYLHSSSWDTRIAASQAVEAIISHVPQWDPPGLPKEEGEEGRDVNGEASTPGTRSPSHWMRFEHFDIHQVLKHSGMLLASEGSEFDLDDDLLGKSKEALLHQRRLLNRRLGLEMAEHIGLDTSELFSTDDLDSSGGGGGWHRPPLPPLGPNERPFVQPGPVENALVTNNAVGVGHVAPVPSPVPCPGLFRGPKRRASIAKDVPTSTKKSRGCGVAIKEEVVCDGNSATEGENLWEEQQSGEWPLEAFVEALCQDLFSAAWEVRHGAATALREVVRLHGRGGGRTSSTPAAQMEAANQLFLEDLSLRLLCVLALDKFGDFVSDQVVAPVRETCAQTLGHVLNLMMGSNKCKGDDTGVAIPPPPSGVWGVVRVLLQLLQRPEWEARHGGLLGIKYLLAVRKDLTPVLIPAVFEPVFQGLQDQNDDVSAVAAAALVPVTEDLVRTLPLQVPRVVVTLWDALLELDDLTSSTSSILMLLAALLSHGTAKGACGDHPVTTNNVDGPHPGVPPPPLVEWVPRLWPFLGHNAVAVRRSVLRSLLILTSEQGTPQPLSEWIPPLLPSMLRLLYQRCLLETSSDVLDLIYQVWEQVVRGAPLGPLLTAACPYLSSWLCLAMHPAHLQIDVTALQWLVLPPNLKPDKKTRRPGSVGGVLSCPPESTPGVPLVGEVYLAGAESLNENPAERERLVLQCRCSAAKLLGLLSGFVTLPMPGLEVPPVESPVESFARLMLFHLTSKSALQRMITAQVMAHWVTLHRTAHACPESVRERVLCCLGETLYFDELASAFTRLQQDARDFVALLRHFGLPLPPGDFPPSVVLTVDQVIELVTTVYQGLVQQVKLRPKVQESLEEKCKGLLKMAVQMQKDQVSLNTMVQAWLATFLVRLGRLPEKLNPVIRPLMESVRREESPLLQEESARSVVQLMSSCVERVPCPNGKIVRNLLTYLCADPSLLHLVAAMGAPATANTSSSSSSSASSSSSSVPTILTLVNMQKSAERAPVRRAGSVSGRRGALQTMHSSESFDDANGPDDESTQRQNEIQRRGAAHVLSMAADHFGAALPDKLPSLWQATLEPLLLKGRKEDSDAPSTGGGSAPNGSVEGPDSSAMPDAAQSEVQELVTTLLGLEVIGPHLHPDLHPKLDATLGPLCAALDHPSPAVRHLSSRCLGMMARVRTAPTMSLVVGAVLAKLGASDNDTQRRGAIEAIACVIESLSLGVVPYLVFLVVPVLGRMSDQDEGVRLMATHCFAHLVRLMPLDGAGIEEASGGPALSAELQERRTSERHFLEQLMDAKHADNYQLSVPINAELRSYQQEGVNWLAFLNRYRLHGILCDDMGLGKTLQSICILASDHHQREMLYKETQRADAKPLPSLVVCPPTLTGHWVYEVEKFVSARYLRPLHYTGPPVERARLQEKARKHNLVVASYDIVRNDIDFFGNIRWNYCILDEGHIIKNGRTKLARALKQLQANHRLILTGTPIQNQVLDLWSLFDFLMPGFLGTERQFAQRFSRPILQSRDAKSSSREQEAGVLAMESLHRQVLPFLLRRVKDDVLKDLPPKIIQDYYCELSPLQVQLYEDFAKSRAKKTVDDSVAATTGEEEPPNSHATAHVFQALQYLRKVCNHPKLVLQPQHPEYNRIMASLEQGGTPLSDISHAAKLRSLRQLLLDCGIGTASGQPEQESVVHAHRALIFCQLKGMLDIVEKDLLLAHMSSVSYLRLDGSVAPGQRQALVQRFNADPSIDVLLLTTQVGGLGLNLTGADTVIFVEHDWNPMKDLQAMDRAHRIGQKKVVNVYRLITRGTLEEKIMGLQKFKLTIANTVITQENSSLNTMGTDQLLDLFTLSSDRRGKSEPIEAGHSLLGGPSSSRAGMKGVLENLPELWDSSKYDSEYDLGSFLSTLKPK
ncbi:TATA-binding protein-associated factor 172-like isoform X1 [Haemaphysalis longicornis]